MTLNVGDLVRFNYLWAREVAAGEETGRKARPVCIVVKTTQKPETLFLLPLTSQRPNKSRAALQVPEMECKRAGLRAPCWIIVDEYNYVSMDAAQDFASLQPFGSFAQAFLKVVAQRMKVEVMARRSKKVVRR